MKHPRKTKRPAVEAAEVLVQSSVFFPMLEFQNGRGNGESNALFSTILFWIAAPRRSAKRKAIILDNLAKWSSLVGSEAGELKDEFIALVESLV